MNEFGDDKEVMRASSTRSIRWRHQNLVLMTDLLNWVRVKDLKTRFVVGLGILVSVDSSKFDLVTKFHCQNIDFASNFVYIFPT